MTANFRLVIAIEKLDGKTWKESQDNRKEQGAEYWRIRAGPLTEKSAVTV